MRTISGILLLNLNFECEYKFFNLNFKDNVLNFDRFWSLLFFCSKVYACLLCRICSDITTFFQLLVISHVWAHMFNFYADNIIEKWVKIHIRGLQWVREHIINAENEIFCFFLFKNKLKNSVFYHFHHTPDVFENVTSQKLHSTAGFHMLFL